MGLAFDELRDANVSRCETSYHGLDDWSPTDWACAMAGEAGELCNLIKKLRRGEDVPKSMVANELADVVIYADLLAARLHISLGDAVREKFNATSRRVGSRHRLAG